VSKLLTGAEKLKEFNKKQGFTGFEFQVLDKVSSTSESTVYRNIKSYRVLKWLVFDSSRQL
jgi:hypothetical protein